MSLWSIFKKSFSAPDFNRNTMPTNQEVHRCKCDSTLWMLNMILPLGMLYSLVVERQTGYKCDPDDTLTVCILLYAFAANLSHMIMD